MENHPSKNYVAISQIEETVRTWSDVWPAIPDTYGAEAGCAPGCTTYGVCNEVSCHDPNRGVIARDCA